ncbi:YfdX family protein [Methylophaga thalassica]|nr:YfdX family protein [Methylophaga thalassica]
MMTNTTEKEINTDNNDGVMPTPEEKNDMVKAVQQEVDQVVETKSVDKRKKTIVEAMEALSETKNALSALDDNDTEKAIQALEQVTGKLELVLARQPDLALAPVDVKPIVHDVFSSTKTIETLLEEAEQALKHGEVQKARHLLSGLASEIIVETTSIPLATFPDAIKAIAPLLDEGKAEAAKTALHTLLGTLVVSKQVIPLPVERARALLKKAEELMKKPERTDEESTQILNNIAEAKRQLEMAQLLGYGHKKDFEDLYEQIKEIDKKAKAGKSGTGFFDELTAKFKALFD